MSNFPKPPVPQSIKIVRFVAGCVWLLAARLIASNAAQGIANRLNAPVCEGILEQAFLLLLLLVGFAVPYGIVREGAIRAANALPKRATSGEEWQRGAALGWAMLLIAATPMMLYGALHPQFWLAPRYWGLALLSLATIALEALALEVAFRGYLFRRLIEIAGPVGATLLMSLGYAVVSSFRLYSDSLSVAIAFFLGILFSIAYLRTHALWLGWGLHFAWNATMAVVLGLPIAGYATYNTLVATSVTGPVWLTGGAYGPEAAAVTLPVVLAACIVLYRITRDYAWEYTHPPIVPAGYPMTVAPPSAHAAMEAAAAAPAPLVQILSTSSTGSAASITSMTSPASLSEPVAPVVEDPLHRQGDTSPKE